MKALFIGGSLHGKIQEHNQCDHIEHIEPRQSEPCVNDGSVAAYNEPIKKEVYNVYAHGDDYSLFFIRNSTTKLTRDLLNTFDISEKDRKWEPAMDARPRTLNCRSVALPLNCKQTNAYARHIVLYLYELKVNRKIDDYLINEYPRNSRVTCTLLKEDTKTDVHLYDGDDIVSKLNETIAVIDSQLNRVKGVEIATQSEAQSGTDNKEIITASKLKTIFGLPIDDIQQAVNYKMEEVKELHKEISSFDDESDEDYRKRISGVPIKDLEQEYESYLESRIEEKYVGESHENFIKRIKEKDFDDLIASVNGFEIKGPCTEEGATISIDRPKTYEDINGILRYTDSDQAVNAISALNTVRKIR